MVTIPWHLRLKDPRPTARECKCEVCGGSFWLPPSKVGQYTTCSDDCRQAKKQARLKELTKSCRGCGVTFVAATPKIVYCTHKCFNTTAQHLFTDEVKAAAIKGANKKRASGEWKYNTGENHHNWKGGKEATLRRAKESGMYAEYQKRYYRKNPDKVRGFGSRKRRKGLSPLPDGTVNKILRLQNGRCAICRTSVGSTYHLDHIMPLALKGKHVASNIQILCPSCNSKKGANDPIDYMQKIGRLL